MTQHSHGVSVQLHAEDGTAPLWNQVACLLESYWFKQNRLWRQLACVWACPMSSPKPPTLFSFINSFYPGSFSAWLPLAAERQNKQLAEGNPFPTTTAFSLNAACKVYFTALWINAVWNHWIWTFLERTTDAEQQLERSDIVQGMRFCLALGS